MKERKEKHVLKRKAAVAGILAALLMAVLGGCENPASSGDAEAVVTIAAIAGVRDPVTGGTPVTAITETAQYTGAVTWGPEDATFEASTVYTATIRVAPKSGYTVAGVPENFFTVAGSNSATNNANSGVITAVFPATGGTPGKPTVIDIGAIPGVRVPVTGETPVTRITGTAQYTGTVTWDPAGATFEAFTVYTATITLTPETGFTLEGVSENFFTLAGVTATNAADSGVVTAVFPATGAVPVTVSDLDLTGLISAPVKNAAPVTEFTAQVQYTGTIAWYTESDDPIEGNFGASTVYKAVLTLTANEGYTFMGVGADAFTCTGGTTITNPADSGIVTITFPATAPALSISGSLSKGTSSVDLGAKDIWLTSGFSGVTVELWTEDGDADTADTLVKRITTTGSSYSFSDVFPGTYRIKAEKGHCQQVSKWHDSLQSTV
jgi:hypothetical protein